MKLRDIAYTILLFFEAIWYTIDSVFLWIYLVIAAKNSIGQGKSSIDVMSTDTSIIQSAINNINNVGGGKVLIKAGTYLILLPSLLNISFSKFLSIRK